MLNLMRMGSPESNLILFGVQCTPYKLHPGVELHKIWLLRLPPKEEALILGGNTLRLLKCCNL